MLGLIRSEQENKRQQAFVQRAAPDVDVRKLAVYHDGLWAYTLTALTPEERKAMRTAGYEWCGNVWIRRTRPKLRLVK